MPETKTKTKAKTQTNPKAKSAAKPKKKAPKRDKLAERAALAAAIRGKYAWIPYSSEDFIRDKRREIALEDRA